MDPVVVRVVVRHEWRRTAGRSRRLTRFECAGCGLSAWVTQEAKLLSREPVDGVHDAVMSCREAAVREVMST